MSDMNCFYCKRPITKDTDPRGVINVREEIDRDGTCTNVEMCTPCWDENRPTVIPHRLKWAFYDEAGQDGAT